MPPRELFFYVFGLAWRIHGISFVRTFEGKCSKHHGSNKSPTGVSTARENTASSVSSGRPGGGGWFEHSGKRRYRLAGHDPDESDVVRVLPDRKARVAEHGAPRHHVSGHEPREPADREQDDRGTVVSVGGEPGAEYVAWRWPPISPTRISDSGSSPSSAATATRQASIRHTCSTTSTV
jgi:hypothetical protein